MTVTGLLFALMGLALALGVRWFFRQRSHEEIITARKRSTKSERKLARKQKTRP